MAFILRFGRTDQIKMSSATVWNGAMTSPVARGPSADIVPDSRSSCTEGSVAQVGGRVSDWREAYYECQPSAVLCCLVRFGAGDEVFFCFVRDGETVWVRSGVTCDGIRWSWNDHSWRTRSVERLAWQHRYVQCQICHQRATNLCCRRSVYVSMFWLYLSMLQAVCPFMETKNFSFHKNHLFRLIY